MAKTTKSQNEIERLIDALVAEVDRERWDSDTFSQLKTQLHEVLEDLRTHQEELRAQNEELDATRARAETFLSRYETLFEASPVGYMLVDRDHLVIRQANRAVADLLGPKTVSSLRGKTLFPLVVADDMQVLVRHYTNVFTAKGPVVSELALKPKGLPPVPVQFTSQVVADPETDRRLSLTVVFDLRDRKTSEEALLEAEATDRASKMKSHLLASASHDLRQPLQAMQIFLHLLDNRLADPEDRHLLSRIETATSGLRNLLDGLLDMSRIEAGLMEPQRRTFPIGPLLERFSHEFTPLFAKRGLRLRTTACSAVIESDPMLLERILRNLLSNALHYTETGGALLGCRRDGERVRIEVWDTGIGIDAAHTESVFEAYSRLGPPRARQDRGMGLGLAIVRRLADKLGHPLSIRSHPGKGSVFSVSVPRSDAALDDSEAPAGDFPTLDGWVLALVDDEEDVREALSSLLESWGARVIVAAGGRALAAALDAESVVPDAVLADISLGPEESGIEVVEGLRARLGDDLPALLITGETAPDYLREARRYGLPFLCKPVPPDDLHAAVTRLLEGSGPGRG